MDLGLADRVSVLTGASPGPRFAGAPRSAAFPLPPAANDPTGVTVPVDGGIMRAP